MPAADRAVAVEAGDRVSPLQRQPVSISGGCCFVEVQPRVATLSVFTQRAGGLVEPLTS